MPVRPEYVLAASEESPYYGRTKTMAQLLTRADGERYQTAELPPGWLMRRWGGWEGWTPRDWAPRVQGWKIHVSTTPDCAVETLTRATRICVDRQVAFKFLPEPGHLLDSNGKQQDRGASGKFITIYPDDDEQFAQLLAELDEALAGQDGPYILSDLRYGDGPVYVRYGGIMAFSYPDALDRPLSAIASLPNLHLVRDQRQPRFHVPDGVELPACLGESLARSRTSNPSRLQEFKAVSALHFSNAGGVYKATLPDGTRHVLREARSHTGLDARGRDAVTRQHEEEEVLKDLIGVPGVQQLVGSFWSWEHRYLELEYAEGRSLTSWVVLNTPFDGGDDGTARVPFTQRALHVGAQLIDIVQRVHDRGWCVGDLHPGNVLVSDDDQVTLLDLEDATRVGGPREVGFRVFEFCAPAGLNGVQADWYAVSRSLMLMYVAEWEIEIAAPSFWDVAMQRAEHLFGSEAVAQIRSVLARFPVVDRHMLAPRLTIGTWSTPPTTQQAITALDDGISWSRQFSESGSFPGDPTQTEDVTESLGFGRAGVVWARTRMGRAVEASDVDALEASARREGQEPGLWCGRAGVALALAEAGRHEAAVVAASSALTESNARRRLDLFGGRAGAVLAAIEVARLAGDSGLLADALVTNERLQRGVVPETSSWTDLTHRRGLHFGLSGLALVDLVAHLATGDAHALDRAIERLRIDLEECITTEAGDLMVCDVDNNRALPYVEWGSAGIWAAALAAERLSGRRLLTDAELQGVVHACTSDVYVYNCLDHGRAGIMAVLSAAGPDLAHETARQRDMLLENLLEKDGMAFTTGDGLVRLSSDLSTGAAGVALALACAQGPNPFAWLPVAQETAERLSALPLPGGPAWGEATAPDPDDAVAPAHERGRRVERMPAHA